MFLAGETPEGDEFLNDLGWDSRDTTVALSVSSEKPAWTKSGRLRKDADEGLRWGRDTSSLLLDDEAKRGASSFVRGDDGLDSKPAELAGRELRDIWRSRFDRAGSDDPALLGAKRTDESGGSVVVMGAAMVAGTQDWQDEPSPSPSSSTSEAASLSFCRSLHPVSTRLV